MITDPALAQKVHYFFEWAALLTGLLIYSARRRKAGAPGLLAPGSFAPLLGGLLGAAVGNKLAFWFDSSIPWSGVESVWSLILGGQSVVGGSYRMPIYWACPASNGFVSWASSSS